MPATQKQGEAITLHDKSMVVTAGAGTGKTYVLVQKYIDLLVSRGVAVPQILALTFTDKAAAEMKDRIRREILARSGPQWEKAAEDFLIAPVQTFHSFCAQVLREFPIEAGLEPGFVVLDEQQASRIHSDAFEELIHTRQEGPVNDALVHVLSITDQFTLRTMLAAMYGKRDRYRQFFAALSRNEADVLSIWKKEVDAFRDGEIATLQQDPSFTFAVTTLLGLAAAYEGVDDKAVAFLQDIRPLLSVLEKPPDTAAFCSAGLALSLKKSGNVGSKAAWKGSDLATFKRYWKTLADILSRRKSLFRMTVAGSDPVIAGSVQLLQALSLVFARYQNLVGTRKAALSGLDFTDLILHARRLFLEKGGLVATHFMPRFRYILVDEFQDTDIAQFEIILAIIGTPAPTTDCLFIVGDPKQSIYLFRDADVTRFKEAQEIITSLCRGRVVDLDVSFRSTKEVIGLANTLFSRLLSSSDKPWDFSYEPVTVSRTNDAGSVELLLPPAADDAPARKRNEADMVARRIHSIVNAQPLSVYEEQPDHTFTRRPARYGDVAILLEQRTNLSYYIAALGEYGIPFYVHGGTGFYHRQEIYDVYSILSFLEHRHDDISLAGILRSPYFGITDAELFRIARERGRTLWDKLSVRAEEGGTAARARDLLASWRKYAGRVTLVALLRRIFAESGIYTVYAALPAGEQILANVEKLVGMARSREEAGPYGLADFTADLRMAMDEDEREGEAPLDALATDAVNIMTVHAAKGLEFPIVVVPDMGAGFPVRYPPVMIGDNPLVVGIKAPDPEGDYEMTESAVLLMLREQQKQKERAEKKRLLYVALTRARDHLIMSGTAPDDPGLPYDLATSRIEWIFTELSITPDAVAAGGLDLPLADGTGPVRLRIVADPAKIPAESGRVEPSLIVVPEECAGKTGTWKAPEYSVGPQRVKPISVSELEKKDRKIAAAHEPARSNYLPEVEGTLKGTIIHEVLRGRDAATVLKEYGEFSEEHVRQCEGIVAKFFASDLMKRVKRSYCEVPFVVTVDGKPVTGKIDRLCEMEDGSWVVIDYKSEPVTPADFTSVSEGYTESMEGYRQAAGNLLGTPVAVWLYFTEHAEFYPVILSEK